MRNILTDEEFARKVKSQFPKKEDRQAAKSLLKRFQNVAAQDIALRCLAVAKLRGKFSDAIMEIYAAYDMHFARQSAEFCGDPESLSVNKEHWQEIFSRLGIEDLM